MTEGRMDRHRLADEAKLACLVCPARQVSGQQRNTGLTPSSHCRPIRKTPSELPADLYEDVPSLVDLARAKALGAHVALSEPMIANLDVDAAPGSALRDPGEVRVPIFARLGWMSAPDGGRDPPDDRRSQSSRLSDYGAVTSRSHCRRRLGDCSEGHRLGLVLSADGWPAFWPAHRGADVAIRAATFVSSIRRWPHQAAAKPIFAPPQIARSHGQRDAIEVDRSPTRSSFHRLRLASYSLSGTQCGASSAGAPARTISLASRFDLALLNDGDEARATKLYRVAFERPGWSIRIDTRLEVTSTPDAFEIAWTVDAEENGRPFHRAEDRASVPRDTV